MINRLNHVNVFVLDQDRAKTFYTETLGFELRNDAHARVRTQCGDVDHRRVADEIEDGVVERHDET